MRCPQNPFNSLFNSSSANHSPRFRICCFEKLANACTWLLGNDVNSVTLNKEFEILGELPKSLISDFGLKGGKPLYKDDTRIQLIQVKGS